MSIAAPAPVAAQESSAQPMLVRRAAVLGAGTMGSRIAAHLANAGIPSCCSTWSPKAAGAQRNRWPCRHSRHSPSPSPPLSMSRPRRPHHARQLRRRPAQARPVRLGHRSRRRESRNQARAARARPAAPGAPGSAHHQHLGLADRADCRGVRRSLRRHRNDSSAPTSSIRRATCSCLRSFPRPRPIPRSWPPSPPSPTGCSASRWCSPTTRPTSSPTASASPSCSPPQPSCWSRA